MPDFEIFRDLDRFLFIWSSGLKWLKKPEEHNVSKVASIWALAGWTVLTDTYENFADEDDKWFEDFARTQGTFAERFEAFKKQLSEKLAEKGKTFEYPAYNKTKITKWGDTLNNLPERFQAKKAATKDSGEAADATPQDIGQ